MGSSQGSSAGFSRAKDTSSRACSRRVRPSGPGAAVPGGTLNLNTATAAELETLPRVGPVLAGRIVEFRQQHGGFAAVTDLDGRITGGQVLTDRRTDSLANFWPQCRAMLGDGDPIIGDQHRSNTQ